MFSDEEIERLRVGRLEHPDLRTRKKFDVLDFKSQGMLHAQIAELTGLSLPTVPRYLDQFLANGLEELTIDRQHRPSSALMDYRELLEDHFCRTRWRPSPRPKPTSSGLRACAAARRKCARS